MINNINISNFFLNCSKIIFQAVNEEVDSYAYTPHTPEYYQPASSNSQETYQYVEEPQPHYHQQEYQEEYQEELSKDEAEKKSRSGFLLKSAFRRVTSMLDSLFYKG